MPRQTSQLENFSPKYLEGAYLSRHVSPDAPAAYSEAMLAVLRGDGREKIRVRAPHTKKGYYYRMQETSDKPNLPKPPASPKSGGGSSINGGIIAALVGGGIAAGAIVGAASGAFAGNWMAQDGVKKQVDAAQQEAQRQAQQEVGKVRQQAEQAKATEIGKLREEYDRNIEAAATAAKQRAEAEFRQQEEQSRQAGTDQLVQSEVERQRLTDELNQRTSLIDRIKEKSKKQVTKLANQIRTLKANQNEEVARRVKAEVEPAVTELEAARRRAEADFTLRSAEMEAKFAQDTAAVQATIEDRANERAAQLVNRTNLEKMQAIEASQRDAKAAADAEVRKRIQDYKDNLSAGGKEAGELLVNDEDGISIAASVRRGYQFDTPGRDRLELERQFDAGVQLLTTQFRQRALGALAPELRDRLSGIRGNAEGKPRYNHIAKWQDTEHALIRHGNRENAVHARVDDVQAKYAQLHRQALDRFLSQAEGRGQYAPDLVERFDEQLKELNRAMRGELAGIVEESKRNDPLDQPFLGGKG